jgi:hypothetical protein
LTALKTIPEAFESNSYDDDVIEWQRHKGWWLSDGTDDCANCPAGSLIPEGRPIYLPGDVGLIYCIHHAPVAAPKGVS